MLKREELDEIAMKVAEYDYNAPCITGEAHLSEMKHFAHALLCEVQKRLEVDESGFLFGEFPKDELLKRRHFTTLPLIEE